ncbi:MAG: fumarylacetoacetate hydrolase family protein [Anditalea sp.]
MLYRLYKTKRGILIKHEDDYFLLKNMDWNEFINDDNLHQKIAAAISSGIKSNNGTQLILHELLAPIDRQEIWASGVTYYRSKEARMEEAKNAGGATFYDRVYEADRPELFFKATAQRTVGSGEYVNIRKDSDWDVPEPELTLFITSNAKIVGYTIGNDMSSRSIEGENPLYLPQAKVYEKSAGLGPCLSVPKELLSPDTSITMEIIRNGHSEFLDSIAIDKMKREHTELVQYLFMECIFPYGCFLMTGTGMVPPKEFTLRSEDEIRITIDNIGTLINRVN